MEKVIVNSLFVFLICTSSEIYSQSIIEFGGNRGSLNLEVVNYAKVEIRERTSYGDEYLQIGAATPIMYDKQAKVLYLVTAKHVVKDLNLEYWIRFEDGWFKYRVLEIQISDNLDLAFLKVSEDWLSFRRSNLGYYTSDDEDNINKPLYIKSCNPSRCWADAEEVIFQSISYPELVVRSPFDKTGTSGGPIQTIDGNIVGIVISGNRDEVVTLLWGVVIDEAERFNIYPNLVKKGKFHFREVVLGLNIHTLPTPIRDPNSKKLITPGFDAKLLVRRNNYAFSLGFERYAHKDWFYYKPYMFIREGVYFGYGLYSRRNSNEYGRSLMLLSLKLGGYNTEKNIPSFQSTDIYERTGTINYQYYYTNDKKTDGIEIVLLPSLELDFQWITWGDLRFNTSVNIQKDIFNVGFGFSYAFETAIYN